MTSYFPQDLSGVSAPKGQRPRVQDVEQGKPDNSVGGFATVLKDAQRRADGSEGAASKNQSTSSNRKPDDEPAQDVALGWTQSTAAPDQDQAGTADAVQTQPDEASPVAAKSAEVTNLPEEIKLPETDLTTKGSESQAAADAASVDAAAKLANDQTIGAGTKSEATKVEVVAAHTAVSQDTRVIAGQPMFAANSNMRGETARDLAGRLDASGKAQAVDASDDDLRKLAHTTTAPASVLWLSGETGQAGAATLDTMLEASGGSLDAPLSVSAATGQATGASAQPVVTAAAVDTSAMKPQANVIAAPEDIVDILSSKLSGGDKPDRITVQLDPPELGRVSIEFKFDSNGLQQVAVVGETPEAMKRLRLMHFDLVQSLADNGLTARDMTFSQNSHSQRDAYVPPQFSGALSVAEDTISPALLSQQPSPRQLASLSGGLNLKL
ncbi:flagellar hook-length control protein FliK [Henriciella litoralis]|uniref:flagellar hook-length control protein FliK n=1 Tax=Henriciella litoralis TaxID=568102 RepID=UPI000A006D9F|nr:flagellar hook-length control protein FliK [Henriciella litoralis]